MRSQTTYKKPTEAPTSAGLLLFPSGEEQEDDDEHYIPEAHDKALTLPKLRRVDQYKFPVRLLYPVSKLRVCVDSHSEDSRLLEADSVRLPPFGRDFQPVPKTGVRVAIGPGVWDFAQAQRNIPNGWNIPVMVLPVGEDAKSFIWPSDGLPALIYEKGEAKGDKQARERLAALAKELLLAGASSVVALRDAYTDYDPRVFFDLEIDDVAA